LSTVSNETASWCAATNLAIQINKNLILNNLSYNKDRIHRVLLKTAEKQNPKNVRDFS